MRLWINIESSQGQRTIFPAFTCAGSTCTITAPPNAHVCPPGWFQLFLLDGPTPSWSQWVRIGGDPAGLGNWPNFPDFTLPGVWLLWTCSVRLLWTCMAFFSDNRTFVFLGFFLSCFSLSDNLSCFSGFVFSFFFWRGSLDFFACYTLQHVLYIYTLLHFFLHCSTLLPLVPYMSIVDWVTFSTVYKEHIAVECDKGMLYSWKHRTIISFLGSSSHQLLLPLVTSHGLLKGKDVVTRCTTCIRQ